MKNKERKLKAIIIILIITILILCMQLFLVKKGIINSKRQIIKEMSESEQVTDLNNQINELNTSHTEYMNYIQTCKTQIATALENEGVTTSNDATLETMAENISKVLQERTKDATATADNITDGKTAYVNGQKIIGTGADVNNNKAKDLSFSINTWAKANATGGGHQYPIKNMNISSYSKLTITGSFSTVSSGYMRIIADGIQLSRIVSSNSNLNLEYNISNYSTLSIHVFGSYNQETSTNLNVNLIV